MQVASAVTQTGSSEPDDSHFICNLKPQHSGGVFCERLIHLMKTKAQNGTGGKQFNILGEKEKKKRSGYCGRTKVVCECTAISVTRLLLQGRETVM